MSHGGVYSEEKAIDGWEEARTHLWKGMGLSGMREEARAFRARG